MPEEERASIREKYFIEALHHGVHWSPNLWMIFGNIWNVFELTGCQRGNHMKSRNEDSPNSLKSQAFAKVNGKDIPSPIKRFEDNRFFLGFPCDQRIVTSEWQSRQFRHDGCSCSWLLQEMRLPRGILEGKESYHKALSAGAIRAFSHWRSPVDWRSWWAILPLEWISTSHFHGIVACRSSE